MTAGAGLTRLSKGSAYSGLSGGVCGYPKANWYIWLVMPLLRAVRQGDDAEGIAFNCPRDTDREGEGVGEFEGSMMAERERVC